MEQQVLKLFDEWNAAVQSGEPERVVALYAPDAMLLPTVSNQIRRNHGEMLDYFKDFLTLGPAAELIEYHAREFGDLLIHSGVYAFAFARPMNGITGVTARFTFVFERRDGRWLIIEHHSSRMPEDDVAGAA